MKTALSIAGSDCSGGAGIQADIKTMSAHGVFGMSVIVSVVAENTSRVVDVFDIPAEMIIKQIDSIFEDIEVDAVKVGMLSNQETMKTVASKLVEYCPRNLVVDPVMYAKNGCPLMNPSCMDTFIEYILPLATILTPNIPEAECITGKSITTIEDMQQACIDICNMGCKNVLVKGGHYDGDAIDILYDGKQFWNFVAKRVSTRNTHGTGCTLSSSIASNLALGKSMMESVRLAKEYVTGAISDALELGKGCGPTNHFYQYFNNKGEKL